MRVRFEIVHQYADAVMRSCICINIMHFPFFSHRICFPTFPYTFPWSPFVPKATFEIVDHAFICCFLSTRPVCVRMSNFTIYFQWSINFFVFPGKFNLLLYRIVILYMITFTFSPFFVLVCPWSDSVITLT